MLYEIILCIWSINRENDKGWQMCSNQMSHTSLVGMLITGSTILNNGLAVAAKAKHMHSDNQAILILGVYPTEMDIL